MQSLGAVILERKTRDYWRVSRQWNGKRKRREKQILTGEAIEICNDAIFTLNPSRPIVKRMSELQHGIIIGISHPMPTPAKVLKFERKAKRKRKA